MTIREVMNGKAQACRKSTLQDYFARKKITDDLPADVRMQKMIALFDCFAQSSRALSDNFPSEEEMEDRMGQFNKNYDIANFQQLSEKLQDSLDLMVGCCDEMAKSPLSMVNGTSVAFAKCVTTCEEEAIRIKEGQKVFASYLAKMGIPSGTIQPLYTSDEACKPAIPAFKDQFVAKMMSFFSACMFIPDMIENVMV